MPWVIDMRYEDGKAIYPPDLPKRFRSRVQHRVANGKRQCLLKIKNTKEENIPGAKWEDKFDINDDGVVHPIIKIRFSKKDQDLVEAAAKSMKQLFDDQDLWERIKSEFNSSNPAEREVSEILNPIAVIHYMFSELM